jgi:cytochrome P450
MATVDDLPTIPMDDPAWWQDPYPTLRALREQHGLARTPQGLPALLRWDDAFDTVRGTQFIQHGIEALEARGFLPGDPLHTWASNRIGVMEGEHHRRVRSLAAGALSKRKMDDLRPLIRHHANALLDAQLDAGEIEGRLAYAHPLPRLVMMDFLGVDEDELGNTMNPSAGSSVIDAFGPGEMSDETRAKVNTHIQAAMDHTAMLYDRRRRQPRDDLLTHLVQAQNEAGRLTEGELVTLFSSIFGSGTSTASIIASGMMELARHPEQADLLRSDPDAWKKGASEESLRYRPAINAIGQKASTDTHAFGTDFAAGAHITVIVGAVNRDPRHWGGSAEHFDIRRDPRDASLSFGVGPHVCLGHAMSRATIEEALAVFVERCDEIELLEEPRWVPFVQENKLENLRLGVRVGERAVGR